MAAQVTASHTSTSGSAGFSGGFFPVAAFHVVSRPFLASAAAPSAAARENTDHTFELSFAIPGPYPASWAPATSAVTAAASSAGCRVDSNQYGAGSSGS